MKSFKITLLVVLVIAFSAQYNGLLSQVEFGAGSSGDAVIVFDGDGEGRSFKVRRPSKNDLTRYPAVGLGNSPVLQESASASKQPMSAPDGYYVIFSIADDIGGKQATYTAKGITYQGIWRVIRPITRSDLNANGEIIVPKGVMFKDKLVADYIIVARANSLLDPIDPKARN